MSWLKLEILQSDRLTAAELHTEEACVLRTSHLQQTGDSLQQTEGMQTLSSQNPRNVELNSETSSLHWKSK